MVHCDCYICRKTERDEDNNKKTGVTTHVSVRPTHSPAWLEMLTLNLDDKKADNESEYRQYTLYSKTV